MLVEFWRKLVGFTPFSCCDFLGKAGLSTPLYFQFRFCNFASKATFGARSSTPFCTKSTPVRVSTGRFA
jgi:hypothetical protein